MGHHRSIISPHALTLMGFLSYQRLGFLLIFVVVQLIPSQNEPAAVPRFDESPLLPEPPAPDDTQASVHLGLTSAALGAAAGRALLLHHGGSDLKMKQNAVVKLPLSIKLSNKYDVLTNTAADSTTSAQISASVSDTTLPPGGRCCHHSASRQPACRARFKQPAHPDEDQMPVSSTSAARLRPFKTPRATNMPVPHACTRVPNMLPPDKMAVCCVFWGAGGLSVLIIYSSHVRLGLGEKWAGPSSHSMETFSTVRMK